MRSNTLIFFGLELLINKNHNIMKDMYVLFLWNIIFLYSFRKKRHNWICTQLKSRWVTTLFMNATILTMHTLLTESMSCFQHYPSYYAVQFKCVYISENILFSENLIKCFVTPEQFLNKGQTQYTLHECKNMKYLIR